MLKAARTCYALASIIARHRPQSHDEWPTQARHMWRKIREAPTEYCLEHDWVEEVQNNAVSTNAVVMHLKFACSRCNRHREDAVRDDVKARMANTRAKLRATDGPTYVCKRLRKPPAEGITVMPSAEGGYTASPRELDSMLCAEWGGCV